jgi:hypothetical protein
MTPTASSRRIHQYERSLAGITSVLYEPRPSTPSGIPSLGNLGNRYVETHGYHESAIRYIQSAYERSNNVGEFTDYLSERGLPEREAHFLWLIINGN